jgi:ketosteroid isomerase-like protein
VQVVNCGGCGGQITYEEKECKHCKKAIDGADAYRLVEASWRSQFQVALALKNVHSPEELQAAVRSHLSSFLMAPRDLSTLAEIRADLVWVPVLSACCTFRGAWQGAATPFKYVTRRGPKGSSTREKRRLVPKVFKGRIAPTDTRVTQHGSAEPIVQILAVDDFVRDIGDVGEGILLDGTVPSQLVESDDVRVPKRYMRLDVAARVALEAVAAQARALAQEDAEEQLDDMTPGDWEDRGVSLDLTLEEESCLLLAVPALIGRYSYQGQSWPLIASGATGKVAVAGSPTSGSKLIVVLGIAAACLLFAAWHWNWIQLSQSPGKQVAELDSPSPRALATVQAVSPTQEAETLLETWVQAQNARDFSAYRGLYAPEFVGVKRVGAKSKQYDLQAWLEERRKFFAQLVDVKASDRQFHLNADGSIVARFAQEGMSGTKRDSRSKEMVLKRAVEGLRIIREEQLDSRTITGPSSSTKTAPPTSPKYGSL